MSGPAKPASAPNPLTQPPSVAETTLPKAVTGTATGLAADQGSLTSESSIPFLSTLLANFCNCVSKLFKNLTNWFVNLLLRCGSDWAKDQVKLEAQQWIAKQKQEFAAIDTNALETSPHWLVTPSSGEPTGINSDGFKFAFLSDGPSAYSFFFMKEVINTALEECLSSQHEYLLKTGALYLLLDSFKNCFRDFRDDSLQEYGGNKADGLHDYLLNEVIGHLEKNKLFKHLIFFKLKTGIKSPQVTALLESVSNSLNLKADNLRAILTDLETNPDFQKLSPLDAAVFIDSLGNLIGKQLRTSMEVALRTMPRGTIPAKEKLLIEALYSWMSFYISYQYSKRNEPSHATLLAVKEDNFKKRNFVMSNDLGNDAYAAKAQRMCEEALYFSFAFKPGFIEQYGLYLPTLCSTLEGFHKKTSKKSG